MSSVARTASSASHPGTYHRVGERCDCSAGSRGLVCKHLAAVIAERFIDGELAMCPHCGYVGIFGRAIVTDEIVPVDPDRVAAGTHTGPGYQSHNSTSHLTVG
ncbi:MAG TPA: hypothetical protein VIK32_16360 [Candidatus Limnocylindrales bacterium]